MEQGICGQVEMTHTGGKQYKCHMESKITYNLAINSNQQYKKWLRDHARKHESQAHARQQFYLRMNAWAREGKKQRRRGESFSVLPLG